MITLQNDQLVVKIQTLGAEVKSIKDVKTSLEFLHDSNPAYWAKSSPVLFPIVGRLANNTCLHNGKTYEMTQHGFGRDLTHEVISSDETHVTFSLKSTEETLAKYPFAFELRISYELVERELKVSWQVINESDETMYFSIGAHPAFSTLGHSLNDYYLHFKKNDTLETFLFDDASGLIFDEKETIIEGIKLLPLGEELFKEFPTIILEDESEITLGSYNHDHEVVVTFEGFPYVGIWTPVGPNGAAPFVCIEPWFGLADTVTTPQELKNKKGIQKIEQNGEFSAMYSMNFR